MHRAFLLTLLLALAILSGCSAEEPLAAGEQWVTLPGGQRIRAEVLTRPEDMQRGMMFRDSLAPDRGMLFVHGAMGRYPYWMFQCRIPLDIVWMDSNRRIVEISAGTPPCRGEASTCPTYGGHRDSMYVLELAGGMASRYGLKLGSDIAF
jgi:uncharacterized membrane protein (UPF0127 family)